MLGGENLHADQARRFRAAFPGAAIVNEYGPTETVVGSVSWTLPARTADRTADSRDTARSADRTATARTLPIGLPLDNTTVRVVDASLNPLPVGVWGELVIGGAGVSPATSANPPSARVLRPRPVHRPPRRPAVPHRRHRPVEPRGPARTPRQGGPPAEDPRLPGRARGDRVRTGGRPGCGRPPYASRRHPGPGSWPTTRPPGRGGHGPRAPARPAARPHGPRRPGPARRAPGHRGRQGRPLRAAARPARAPPRRTSRPARAPRRGPARHPRRVVRRARHRRGRTRRALLRRRRNLADAAPT
ncbi:AMP-binding protein [Streptomyces sp. M19]